MLTIENKIPLEWYPVDLPINAQKILEIQKRNKQILLVLLEKHNKFNELENETEDSSAELKALHHKVDLLTTWVSRLLIKQFPLPDDQFIKISSKGITVSLKTKLSQQFTWQFESYIDPDIPQALIFQGTVSRVNETEFGFDTVIDFINLGEEVQDLIDKLIFQNHRRLIAQTKSKQ